MKNPLKPRGHWINNRACEMLIGAVLLIIGATLLWDSTDNRGRKLPWPASGLAPW